MLPLLAMAAPVVTTAHHTTTHHAVMTVPVMAMVMTTAMPMLQLVLDTAQCSSSKSTQACTPSSGAKGDPPLILLWRLTTRRGIVRRLLAVLGVRVLSWLLSVRWLLGICSMILVLSLMLRCAIPCGCASTSASSQARS